jgi:DNA helicase HerA-like ATPase
MPPKKKKDENELIDFYKVIDKSLLKNYRNPNYEKHNISIPFLMGIFGGSGSGKTQTLMNILKKFNGTFTKIVLCVRSIDEPLYLHLRNKLPPSSLEIFENGVVPLVDDYKEETGEARLIIFDDLIVMKSQSPIIEWMIRGRKLGFSMCYISQSFYKVPKLIRVQMNYIVLKRLTSLKDLKLILGEYNLSQNKDQIIKIYKDTTHENKQNFLMIRCDFEPSQRFSVNFLKYVDLGDDI